MDRLERVARAICEANGKDPDGDCGQGKWVTRTGRAGGAQYMSRQREAMPNWRLFEAEARVFVAAHAALADEGVASDSGASGGQT